MSKELLTAQSPLSLGNCHNIILYSSAPSPCVRRVRITLIEKGLDFDTVEISLPNMEQHTQAYLALNPNGYVPTMSHGEQVIFESAVINQYLEDQFPQTPLMPKDPAGQAQVAMWIEAEATMAKIFRPIMYQRIMGPVVHISRSQAEAQQIVARSTTDTGDQAWQNRVWNLQVLNPNEETIHQRQLLQWLDLLEQALVDQDYLVGNQFSQADISLFPRIDMYGYLDISLNSQRFPNVLRWMDLLRQRPSFEKSMTEDAKKLRKMATSNLLPKVRKILQKPKRSMRDKLFIWGIGRIMRKMQKVDALLADKKPNREIPQPKKTALPIKSVRQTQFIGLRKKHNITLYGSSHSLHSQRIVSLMQQLNIEDQYEEINLQKNQHKSPEFLAINPHAQVPVLKHGSQIFYDSGVIAQYLCQLFDEKNSWFPNSSWQAAQHRMWLALESGTHKEFKPLWDQYISKQKNIQSHILNEKKTIENIYKKLNQLEKALTSTAFLCGDSIHYADIAWHSRIDGLNNIPAFSLDNFPAIQVWLALTKSTLKKPLEDEVCL